MKNFQSKNNRGFIKTIIIIIVALVILEIMGYDVRDIFSSPKFQHLLQIVWDLIKDGWILLLDAVEKVVKLVKPFWNNL